MPAKQLYEKLCIKPKPPSRGGPRREARHEVNYDSAIDFDFSGDCVPSRRPTGVGAAVRFFVSVVPGAWHRRPSVLLLFDL